MQRTPFPKKFFQISTTAVLFMTGAQVAYADATAPCNAVADPTALECGVNSTATGVDAMAVGERQAEAHVGRPVVKVGMDARW